MGAPVATAETAGSDVEISYVAADGSSCTGWLDELWSVPFERVGPARAFGSFKGQGSFQGLWWSATTGAHVGFESWLERDNVMLLDSDPLVTAIASQPFWLSWTSRGKVRRHCPDYFTRRADGTAVVVDVRADERIEAGDTEAFAMTERACENVGWRYRRVGAVDPVLLANVRWLSGYRHPRCLNEVYASRLRENAARHCSLAEVAGAIGDGLAVLPTLYHLLWSGVVSADLRGAPLTAATTLTLPAAAT